MEYHKYQDRIWKGIFAMGAAALCVMAGHISPLYAKDLVVIEDRINLSAPDAKGVATISAPAGSVMISPHAVGTFSIENSGNKERISGMVNTNGSFLGKIRASVGDKIKIIIMTSTDEKKKIKKKVPPPLPAPSSAKAKAATVRAQKGSALNVPDPTPEIIIRYKEAPGRGSTVRAGRPIDVEAEVLESGVLPPQ
ncbi:MAG: hypothetical protein P8123_03605 [bacterium]|jgi:hypothetical protein